MPGLKPFAAVASVLLLCAIVAGGYVAGTEEEGVERIRARTSTALTSRAGSSSRTASTPGRCPFGESRLSDIHLTHRVFVYGATLAIVALLLVAYRRGARSRWMAAALALLVLQVLLGALNVWLGEHASLVVAHLVTATLLWSTVVLVGECLAWPSPRLRPQRATAGRAPRRRPAGA